MGNGDRRRRAGHALLEQAVWPHKDAYEHPSTVYRLGIRNAEDRGQLKLGLRYSVEAAVLG